MVLDLALAFVLGLAVGLALNLRSSRRIIALAPDDVLVLQARREPSQAELHRLGQIIEHARDHGALLLPSYVTLVARLPRRHDA